MTQTEGHSLIFVLLEDDWSTRHLRGGFTYLEEGLASVEHRRCERLDLKGPSQANGLCCSSRLSRRDLAGEWSGISRLAYRCDSRTGGPQPPVQSDVQAYSDEERSGMGIAMTDSA